ncbi:unnamed protein product [Ixodes hexagonus]
MEHGVPKARKPGTRYCCVVGCHNSISNTKGKVPAVKFYLFPGRWYQKDRREAWIRAVQRTSSDGSPWLPTKSTTICSRHFINNPKSENQTDPAYLPTLFPDTCKRKPVSGDSHEGRAKRTHSVSARTPSPPRLCEQSPPGDVLQTSDLSESEVSPQWNVPHGSLENLLLLADVAGGALSCLPAAVQETQMDTENCKGPLQLMLSSTDGVHGSTQVTHIPQADKVTHPQKSWARRCGFHGFESIESSEQVLQDLCCVTMTVFSILLNMLPEQRYRSSDVTREDRLVLFLMKLKLGVSLTALGAIFGISKSTASRVFRVTLHCLSIKLANWVFVPPRCAIKDTMPACFLEHYPRCTFIIDCTEVRTETPTDPEAQHYLYTIQGVLYFKVACCHSPQWHGVLYLQGVWWQALRLVHHSRLWVFVAR